MSAPAQPPDEAGGDIDAETLLAQAAGAGIHRLAIPTPFAVGRVNCYLIEDSPLTLIDQRLRMHERRAAKIHGLIAAQPRSAYELAQAMWGNVAVTQAYLTLSEVLGHVDLLLADGRVAEQETDGVVRFVAT